MCSIERPLFAELPPPLRTAPPALVEIERLDDHYAAAELLWQSGDHHRAVALWQTIAVIAPRSAERGRPLPPHLAALSRSAHQKLEELRRHSRIESIVVTIGPQIWFDRRAGETLIFSARHQRLFALPGSWRAIEKSANSPTLLHLHHTTFHLSIAFDRAEALWSGGDFDHFSERRRQTLLLDYSRLGQSRRGRHGSRRETIEWLDDDESRHICPEASRCRIFYSRSESSELIGLYLLDRHGGVTITVEDRRKVEPARQLLHFLLRQL